LHAALCAHPSVLMHQEACPPATTARHVSAPRPNVDQSVSLTGFRACRDIPAFEELVYDYCYKAGSVPEKEINCRCGARNCRKKLL